MFKSKDLYTCIQVGTHSLKVAVGKWKNKQVILQKLVRYKYELGEYQKSGIEIQLKTLKQIDPSLISGNIILSFSDPRERKKTFTLTSMNKDELIEAVKWEVSQKKHINEQAMFYDFISSPLNYNTQTNQCKVFLTSRLKTDIEKIIDHFPGKQKEIKAIENQNFALINALDNFDYFLPTKAYVVISLKGAFFYLLLIYDGKLVLERRLALGSNSLTENIAESVGLDLQTAEKLKTTIGIGKAETPQEHDVKNAILSSFDNLISEIQYSMKYFSYQETKSQVTNFDKIILSGGGALIPGVKAFFSHKLNIPCEIVDLKDKVILPPDLKETPTHEIWPSTCDLLGLGFWNHKQINSKCSSILPSSLTSRKGGVGIEKVIKMIGSFLFPILLLAIIIIGGFAHIKYLDIQIKKIKKTNTKLLKKIDSQQKVFDQQKEKLGNLEEKKLEIKNDLLKSQAKINAFSLYEKQIRHSASLLEFISTKRPKQFFIDTLNFKNNKLTISGESQTFKEISDFMKILNQSPYFKNCKFIQTKNKNSKINFKINAEKVIK